MKQFLRKIIISIYKFLVQLLRPDRHHVVLESSVGRSISGSPAAICRVMRREESFRDFKYTWVITNPELVIPADFSGCRFVKKNSPAYFFTMLRAGIWISDGRLADYLVKRPEVVYLQTWHGTPLKKLALDMDMLSMSEGKSLEQYRKEFRQNASTWDALISQNHFSTECFRRCFDFQKTMLEIGYPRNDVLFEKNNPADILALKKKYQLPTDKKIILYAPTWRDNRFHANGIYQFVSDLDFDEMYRCCSSEYILLIKYHYLVKEQIDWDKYHGFVRAFSAETEISDLYLMADYLITDYSSAMFDFSLLKRPILFFVPDMEEYRSELRGFYFDLFSNAPGPVLETTDALCEALSVYDTAVYDEAYRDFCMQFHSFDDGHASEKAVEWLKHQIMS